MMHGDCDQLAAGCFACILFVACVLSVMVCFLFLLMS